jgi:F-type H+-transporting ATPase subunit b
MKRFPAPIGWIGLLGLLLAFGTAGLGPKALAQERNPQEARSSEPSNSTTQNAEHEPQHPSLGGELAKETNEVDSNEHLKKSPSVEWIARHTGLSLEGAYWLAVFLNFAVIFGVTFWAARKYLPTIFRDRTAAIQKSMEEARRASEDANRRLAEIELRLSKLGDEINGMKMTAEKDIAGEEARIQAAATEDGRKIVEAAEQEIASAAKSARRDLATYAADLAVALAKRQIHVDPGTDELLVRSFAEGLGKPGEGSKN